MISNNKISSLVKSQVPFFVRNDHATFVRFIEAYYEFLEQNDQAVNGIKTAKQNIDVDLTIDVFADKMYEHFMKTVPSTIIADKKLVMKNIKDFYRAKGTEKSAQFLMRILYNQDIELYYPKKDILKTSDGKWFIQKSLRVNNITVDDVTDTSLAALDLFIGSRIRGQTSNTTAIVERVDRLFEQGSQVDELIISNIDGSFNNGEQISGQAIVMDQVKNLKANIFSGILNTVTIQNAGSGYQIGDPVIVVSNTGSGACVVVASVTTGNISSIVMDTENFGAGYRVNDIVLSTGGGGSGLNAVISLVETNESHHPNSYNIIRQTISLEANTLLSNSVYSNLNSANINTSIQNATNTWTFSNTGPALTVLVLNAGTGYLSVPSLSIVANSAIQQLGILGRMDIISGGSNYRIGDKIEFINGWGSYGHGATANVTNVGVGNTITDVRFVQMPGHFIGGSGYNQTILPRANVISSTGSGANIRVSAILGAGGLPIAQNSNIGAIDRIIIINKGVGYTEVPTLNLSASGDGTAQANVSIIQGVYSYPGRFLNDDGHISSYNFLENRDYYQNFSYAIRVKRAINDYRQAFKDLVHPAGTKLFGEYLYLNQNEDFNFNTEANAPVQITMKLRPFSLNLNVVNISYTAHGFANNSNVYLEYASGGSNVANGIGRIIFSDTNFFRVAQNVASAANTTGNVLVGIIST